MCSRPFFIRRLQRVGEAQFADWLSRIDRLCPYIDDELDPIERKFALKLLASAWNDANVRGDCIDFTATSLGLHAIPALDIEDDQPAEHALGIAATQAHSLTKRAFSQARAERAIRRQRS